MLGQASFSRGWILKQHLLARDTEGRLPEAEKGTETWTPSHFYPLSPRIITLPQPVLFPDQFILGAISEISKILTHIFPPGPSLPSGPFTAS